MTKQEVTVLFVCTANVCRSPLAEAWAIGHASQANAPLRARSASIHEVTRKVHPMVERILGERNQKPVRTHSQPLSSQLVDEADLIMTMTGRHAISVAGKFRAARTKVFMLDHFVRAAPPRSMDESITAWLRQINKMPRTYPNQMDANDIADPVDQDEDTFRAISDQIDAATQRLVGLVAGTVSG